MSYTNIVSMNKFSADTVIAYNEATQPAAGATIVESPSLTGFYEVNILTSTRGTDLKPSNMNFSVGSTVKFPIYYNQSRPESEIWNVYVTLRNQKVNIKAIAAASLGVIYSATIFLNKIGD